MAAPDAAAAAAAAAASSSLPPKLVMKVIFSSRPGVGERERERDSDVDSEGDLQSREGPGQAGLGGPGGSPIEGGAGLDPPRTHLL